MQRVTKDLLRVQAEWLSDSCEGSYRVQYENGKARIQTKDGAENISQYGTKREISMVLDAMIKLAFYEHISLPGQREREASDRFEIQQQS